MCIRDRARAVAGQLEVREAIAVAAVAAMEVAVMGMDSLAAVEAPAEMHPARPAGRSVVGGQGADTGPSRSTWAQLEGSTGVVVAAASVVVARAMVV